MIIIMIMIKKIRFEIYKFILHNIFLKNDFFLIFGPLFFYMKIKIVFLGISTPVVCLKDIRYKLIELQTFDIR
jgi:hypothetical protein